MTYYINVKSSNLKDFLQIIRSLKNLGVIDSYGSVGDLVKEGEPMSAEDLISVLEFSRREAKEGHVLPLEEVKNRWKVGRGSSCELDIFSFGNVS